MLLYKCKNLNLLDIIRILCRMHLLIQQLLQCQDLIMLVHPCIHLDRTQSTQMQITSSLNSENCLRTSHTDIQMQDSQGKPTVHRYVGVTSLKFQVLLNCRREKIGHSGGNWRHIKQVLGYGGNQVCFVDGKINN